MDITTTFEFWRSHENLQYRSCVSLLLTMCSARSRSGGTSFGANGINGASPPHNISKELAWLTTQRYVDRRDYLVKSFGLRSLDPQGDLDRAFRLGELRQFASNEFVHIGAHTRHHENLRTLDAAAVNAEIRNSIKDIEHLIGYKPATFSYPHGIWNRRATSLARTAGINFAFTTDASRNPLPRRQAALTLGRASIKHGEPIAMQCDRLRSKFRVRPVVTSLVTKVDDCLYGWRFPSGNQAHETPADSH